MKKIILMLLIIIPILSFSANKKTYVYCQLVGVEKALSNKVNVQIDFGQSTNFWKGVDYLKDEKGKKVTFNSMIDAMNYMGSQGWEFVQAYVLRVNDDDVCHWLLKKELEEFEEEEILTE